MNNVAKKNIIWVDDDAAQIKNAVEILRDHALSVMVFSHPTSCCKYLASNPDNCSVVITDIVMPNVSQIEVIEDGEEKSIYAWPGYDAGLILARWIKRHYPNISVVGVSAIHDPIVSNWFATFGDGLFNKWEASKGGMFVEKIKQLAGLKRSPLKSFIVHGHDILIKLELKNYLQNVLGFAEPIVLHEQPNIGRTIIEKFESLAETIEFVFVLMTPDDEVVSCAATNDRKRRARQNVIFELGYFFGKFQRKTNRVFLLYKGEIELPSDISGLVYIDISNGIEAAGEKIRKEIFAVLST
ncbi:MAG: TIR domain-containing protein [Candidatus Methylumidiphilus sp.]